MSKILQLPWWLDKIIFEDFGAIYEPHPEEVKSNADQTYDFAKIYLGTYFPRSVAEAYYIMSGLLENKEYFDILSKKTELNVFDFCSGMGGEIFGLILIFQEKLPNLKRIQIDAFDANPDYVRYLFHLNRKLKEITNISIEVNINPQCLYVDGEQNLLDLIAYVNCRYHVILSFKALNEFIQQNLFPDENIYYKIANLFFPCLADDGIMLLLDISSKDVRLGRFYPEIMNEGINAFVRENLLCKSIFPSSCNSYVNICNGCYMQDRIYISHSKKDKDVSKIAYRIIGQLNFVQQIVKNVSCPKCKAVNQLAGKESPYQN